MNTQTITYIIGACSGFYLTIQYSFYLYFIYNSKESVPLRNYLRIVIFIGVFIIISSMTGLYAFSAWRSAVASWLFKLEIITGICIVNSYVILMRNILISINNLSLVEIDNYTIRSRTYIVSIQAFSAFIGVITLVYDLLPGSSLIIFCIYIILIAGMIVIILLESREFTQITSRTEGKLSRPNLNRYRIVFGAGIIFIIFIIIDLILRISGKVYLMAPAGSLYMYGIIILSIGFSLNLVFEYMDVMTNAYVYNNKLEVMNRNMIEDIRTAQSLQISLLPLDKQKDIQGVLDMEISYMPLQSVGGDYYDFYRLDDKNILVFLGDASGHGIYAAMIWAILKVEVEELIEEQKFLDISEAITLLNQKITRVLENTYSYATLFACLINTKDKTISYISAGHPDQLYYSAAEKSVHHIRNKNPIIGTFKAAKFNSDIIPIKTGDALLMFSDGYLEGSNPSGEQIGGDKIAEIFREAVSQGSRATDIIGRMLMGLEIFFDGTLQKDDRTIMVIKF